MDSDYGSDYLSENENYFAEVNSNLTIGKTAVSKDGHGKKINSKENLFDPNRRTSVERAQLSTKYQKKTQYEHIMLRPDTYIGSVEPVCASMWVFEDDRMVMRPTTYVPGLYKIFDEILVNASDNKQRDPAGMKGIKVTINEETGEISVWNDGKGIPAEIHREHRVYIPELVFGHLMTGENFEDKEQRVVGGRNGYGAKLANIFSSRFVVETNDSKSGKRYRQEWTSNMSIMGEPKITSAVGKDYTLISFTPDYNRFGMHNGLDKDTMALLRKRVYDIAGVTPKSVKVSLNGTPLKICTFPDYIELYLPDQKDSDDFDENSDSDFSDDARNCKNKAKSKKSSKDVKVVKVFEQVNDRWEICIAASTDGQMQQVSFVNGICTTKGGQHVNYVADQVVVNLQTLLKKKHKGGAELKPHQIKSHLWIFVNSLIVNPAFDSQTKETLTTVKSKFGPSDKLPKLSDRSFKLLEKTPIVENILFWAKAKEMKELGKKAGGQKKSRIKGIDKLDDANNAGGRNSQNCTLILTEGDSAKTLAISGLSVVGRDNYGVFPLRGKLLNVRDASHSQIMKNEEIQSVMKIMGLQPGKSYNDTKDLRYGHLMVMTDQDHDGSHIKGLLMNLIHHFWPSLLRIPRFLQVFVTPIVKVTKGATQSQSFYTMPQYFEWTESLDLAERKRWTTKYYKGLGTSTSKEAKEYFANIDRNRIDMMWEGNSANSALELAFSKKKVTERKEWLLKFQPGTFVDFDVDSMDYTTFVDKELILFSMADNQRSIPSVADGLKPSQRKVLFSCFKRKLKNDIKVAQLVGYVSEHSAYHHGEVSLATTVVGMGQTFVGSNNINLLFPSGQFGSRIMGGKDAASPRYIFTRLALLTRCLFHPHDDAILNYLEDDGLNIEPEFYKPVIPMLLVNGASGIGTGWSTDIPCFNPRDLIAFLRCKLNGYNPEESLVPWYKGFEGNIEPEIHATKGFTGRFKVSGIFERDNDEEAVCISELPVGVWTQSYKQFLSDEKAFPDGFIKDIRENHTDTKVSFTVLLSSEAYKSILDEDKLMKVFKLESTVNITNMVAFNHKGIITKYNSPEDIVDEFFEYRLVAYAKRKKHIEDTLQKEWSKLDNKARFILAVVNGEIIITKRKKADILVQLLDLGFEQFPKTASEKRILDDASASAGETKDQEDTTSSSKTISLANGFDYLLSMALWTLTFEKVQDLLAQRDSKREEFDVLKAKSAEDLWEADLVALEEEIDKQDRIDVADIATEALQCKGNKKAKKFTLPKKPPAVKKTSKARPLSLIDTSTQPNEQDFVEEDTEGDILSLADRIRIRMNVGSPKKIQKGGTKGAPKLKIDADLAKPVQKFSSDSDSDDEIQVQRPNRPLVNSKANKRAKESTPIKVARKPRKPNKISKPKTKGCKKTVVDSSEEDETSSDNNDVIAHEDALAKSITPAPKPDTKRRRLKTIEKPVITKKNTHKTELSSCSEDESEISDDSIMRNQISAAPRALRERRPVANLTVYVEESVSDDEDSIVDDDESDFEGSE